MQYLNAVEHFAFPNDLRWDHLHWRRRLVAVATVHYESGKVPGTCPPWARIINLEEVLERGAETSFQYCTTAYRKDRISHEP